MAGQHVVQWLACVGSSLGMVWIERMNRWDKGEPGQMLGGRAISFKSVVLVMKKVGQCDELDCRAV